MSGLTQYLFIHIVTHEFIIGTREDLLDYVDFMKHKYEEDYTSEYINLGEIIFDEDDISIRNNDHYKANRLRSYVEIEKNKSFFQKVADLFDFTPIKDFFGKCFEKIKDVLDQLRDYIMIFLFILVILNGFGVLWGTLLTLKDVEYNRFENCKVDSPQSIFGYVKYVFVPGYRLGCELAKPRFKND